MTSSKPYLLRAMYDWIADNQLTPYIMIDALAEGVLVPERFIEDGKIVLNIAPQAVADLSMSNEALEFDARFSGILEHIYISVAAIKAIYSFENGRGMVFAEEEDDGGADSSSGSKSPRLPKGKPKLKIVK